MNNEPQEENFNLLEKALLCAGSFSGGVAIGSILTDSPEYALAGLVIMYSSKIKSYSSWHKRKTNNRINKMINQINLNETMNYQN